VPVTCVNLLDNCQGALFRLLNKPAFIPYTPHVSN
jgi:hypothetical protein